MQDVNNKLVKEAADFVASLTKEGYHLRIMKWEPDTGCGYARLRHERNQNIITVHVYPHKWSAYLNSVLIKLVEN